MGRATTASPSRSTRASSATSRRAPSAGAVLDALDAYRDLQAQAPRDLRDEWSQVIGRLEALESALDEAGVDPAAYDPESHARRRLSRRAAPRDRGCRARSRGRGDGRGDGRDRAAGPRRVQDAPEPMRPMRGQGANCLPTRTLTRLTPTPRPPDRGTDSWPCPHSRPSSARPPSTRLRPHAESVPR